MTAAWIGLLALFRERMTLMFTVAGMAAVLGPLLILYGLKYGVISGMMDVLRSDPKNREVIFRGNYSLTQDAIEKLRALPGVAFVIGAPRTIAARMQFEKEGSPIVISAGVIPTEAGDPLLLNIADGLSNNEVILTTSLARKLNVSKADKILAQNSRRMGGVEEIFELRLTVKEILPSHLVDGDRAFFNSGNLEMLEAFLDGYAVGDHRTGQDIRHRPKRYESVRLYTTDLESVAKVDEIISALGYTIASRGAEVRAILALDRSLLLVFGGLALIASTGYAVSLAASLTATFEYNRRHIGLLRLCGASRLEIAMWPLVQGFAITFIGFAVALGVYLAFAVALNTLFSYAFLEGRPICQLSAHHVFVALLYTVSFVLLISLRYSYKIAKISPAEALRIE